MTDIEEEQPTQQRGRRDWSAEGDEETTLDGRGELGGHDQLVDAHDATGTRAFDGKRMAAGPDSPEAPEGLGGRTKLPTGTVGEEAEGEGDANPGGTLSRDPEVRTGEHGPDPEDVEEKPGDDRRDERD